MSKRIDAEKLTVEIRRYKNKADERLKIKGRTFGEEQKDIALQNLCGNLLHFIDSLQQEQQEVDLEKFTEKMDAWKARYNHSDTIPIKATMAFTARMFYMYPNVAREWYESLSKVTMDKEE